MTTDTRIDPATTEARCRRLMAEHAAIEARGWTSERARDDLREMIDAELDAWLEASTSPAPDVAASAEQPDVFRAASAGDAHDIVTEAGRHRCLRCGAESVGAAPALPCIGRGQQ